MKVLKLLRAMIIERGWSDKKLEESVELNAGHESLKLLGFVTFLVLAFQINGQRIFDIAYSISSNERFAYAVTNTCGTLIWLIAFVGAAYFYIVSFTFFMITEDEKKACEEGRSEYIRIGYNLNKYDSGILCILWIADPIVIFLLFGVIIDFILPIMFGDAYISSMFMGIKIVSLAIVVSAVVNLEYAICKAYYGIKRIRNKRKEMKVLGADRKGLQS
jgi:hypothetical protein